MTKEPGFPTRKEFEDSAEKLHIQALTKAKEFIDTANIMVVAGKKVMFSHTAVNKDMHLFIDGIHNPKLCPECIQPGILTEVDV